MRRLLSVICFVFGFLFLIFEIICAIMWMAEGFKDSSSAVLGLMMLVLLSALFLYLGAKLRTGKKRIPNSSSSSPIHQPVKSNPIPSLPYGISQGYFSLCKTQAEEMLDYLDELQSDSDFVEFINSIDGLEDLDEIGDLTNYNPRIFVFLLYDLIKCYDNLGYPPVKESKELLCLILFLSMILAPEKSLAYSNVKELYEKSVPQMLSVLSTVRGMKNPALADKYAFYLLKIYQLYDSERIQSYKVLLYRFSSIIAKADGVINQSEAEYLSGLMKSDELPNKSIHNIEKETPVRLHHDLKPEEVKEAARFVVSTNKAMVSAIQRNFSIGYTKAETLMDELEHLGIIGPSKGGGPRDILVSEDDLERIFRNILTAESYAASKDIKIYSLPSKGDEIPIRKVAAISSEFDSLIGLNSVKAEVKKLQDFIRIQKVRESKGLKTNPISYHCVFTGNPGTGKTTIARIIASIYKDLGILSKGHLVETDRSGLVAEYVGQTAVKTNKIIDSALDGVLFIDEAYSLVQGSENDFGIEAISTLLKRMEDDRSRLVVILAGYGDEMKDFIDANPGLHSRFNRYINFEDYTSDELFSIFETLIKKNDYILTAEASASVGDTISNAIAKKSKHFGNARYVRNLFEKTLENQASRLAAEEILTKEMLQKITVEDIPAV